MTDDVTFRTFALPRGGMARAAEPGPAPMLQWIAIDRLVVDDRYQRDLKVGNWTAIQRIARNFRWSRFSPVFVAPIEGGRFAVIDGQHRTHAALMCGMSEVPCQVVRMGFAEQAAAFAAVNGSVTKVTGWNVLRAALAAGEAWAVACHDAVAEAGCTLMTRNGSTDAKRPGEVYATALIRRHVAAGNGLLVTLALDGLRRSLFGHDAAAWGNDVLRPLLDAVAARPWLRKRGAAAPCDLAPFLDEFDIYAATERAEQFIKVKRRQGVTDISRWDIIAAELGEALDRAFPERMAVA